MSGVRVVVSASAGIRKKVGSVMATAGNLVIGETDSGPGALRMIQSLQPDVVVIDTDSPHGKSAAEMLEEDGQIGLVLLGTHQRRERNGPYISGMILKPVQDTALITAVEFAAAAQHRMRKMADELAKMKETLATRKAVEKAKGILMETLGLPEAQAYKRIQQQSMNKRVSIRRIAEAIITANDFK
ncbi:ANTAR domain-containing response regulator [Dethiobacter alkaliphilus]|uniref:Response regulator receiver and ANTAR domain protein n=1 Tax=Dethiobacter alkaliphilus AHT 1 TaxID=555088 RepID=C0GKN6_DETAL|nr:ANTAR domain-containing protein [Dethiobacter alkaliphilus]EEG76128.1 response regulator receiver and ANTAR domain protein [Dethiobacter alkaliphilus AHT 1]